jgi:hypothetical protein
MSVHVTHPSRQRSALALTTLTCLLCAAPTTAALAQQPDPAPLWKAYPLSPHTSTNEMPGAPLRARQEPRSGSAASVYSPARASVPLAVVIAFYGALAFVAIGGVGAAVRHVVRRTARPVICEITWSPGDEGDAFLATAQLDGTQEWVVAKSPRFDRRSPEPPEDDAASHEAYDHLLRALYAAGWQPYERGRQWWEMRLRHGATTEMPTPARRA